jgi:predicted ATP-binding protein involved in virulence
MEAEKKEQIDEPIYITQLEVHGVNCFKNKYSIDFTDAEGKPSMWNVLLGNNNTGKTTLLRCIAGFTPNNKKFATPYNDDSYYIYSPKHAHDFYYESDQFSLTKIENPNIPQDIPLSASLNALPNISLNTSSTLKLRFSYSSSSIILEEEAALFKIDAYGTQRKRGKGSYIEYKLEDRVQSIFDDSVDNIINAEEWFLGTKFNALMESKKATDQLEQVKEALVTLLPDIKDIQIGGGELRRVHFITNNDDHVLINQLGSGYQSLITWVVDYAKRQFDRYPSSANPLAEPGIVLVDEIDLHLHPTWQRKVIHFLRGLFPKTQFIVTAHSPLVVQSADDINVVVLHRDEETEEIRIEQPELTNFQGWSVEEILRDLMDAQVYSNEYLALRKSFTAALEEDNYEQAKQAYEQLEKILHPHSSQIELMRLQMTSLSYD